MLELYQEIEVPRMKLVAVCDGRSDHRDLFPEAQGFSRLEEMLAAKTVDAVLVATPHPSHVALGLQVLNAGMHLLVEKPLAVHVAEGRQLVDAAQQCVAMLCNHVQSTF